MYDFTDLFKYESMPMPASIVILEQRKTGVSRLSTGLDQLGGRSLPLIGRAFGGRGRLRPGEQDMPFVFRSATTHQQHRRMGTARRPHPATSSKQLLQRCDDLPSARCMDRSDQLIQVTLARVILVANGLSCCE